jgi:hypothetical protein
MRKDIGKLKNTRSMVNGNMVMMEIVNMAMATDVVMDMAMVMGVGTTND